MSNIKNGVWVTMLTPFTQENNIDYGAVKEMLDWYIERAVAGIFAVCQSSEMFYLSLKERYELASFITENVRGKIGVVISGHVEDSIDEQIDALNIMAELEPDALVLVSNRLVIDDDKSFLYNLKRIESCLKTNISLGMYECPYPRKRLISDDELKYMIESGRYLFLKDTSCDIKTIQRRLDICNNSGFKLYNANSATLLDSLLLGSAGYCGVMANFHPDLYYWLCDNPRDEKAKRISDLLSVMSLIEEHSYPYCAKYYMGKFENIGIKDFTRKRKTDNITALDSELDAIYSLTNMIRKDINENVK